MTKPLHIIYIPGLGKRDPLQQRRIIKTWRLWRTEPELFYMNWADNRSWEVKFEHLLARIDDLVAQNKAVALVGASAGASAVINAYAARKNSIVGVVCIAGKVNRPAAIGGGYRSKNPSFVTSVHNCQAALASLNSEDRKRILSRYAVADEIVYKPDSRIAGAHNRIVPIIGHGPIIATQLIFGAPSFIRFLKRLAQQQI